MKYGRIIAWFSVVTIAAPVSAQITLQSQVLSVYPPQNATSVPIHDSLVVQFAPDMNVLPQSLSDTTFVIQAQQSGWHRGTVTYSPQSHTATLKPVKPFFVGELVTAVATKNIQYDSAGVVKNIRGFAWQFHGKVTTRTKATFRGTQRLVSGGLTFLSNLVDIDNDGNVDLLYEHAPGDVIAFNRGDGLTYANAMLSTSGNMFPADYGMQGRQDIVVGFDSCLYASNIGNRTFREGAFMPLHLKSINNLVVDLDFDGIPEIIGATTTKGKASDDTLSVFVVRKEKVANRQAFYAGDIASMCTGDFNNDGAIDVCIEVAGLGSEILFNDGTGHLNPPVVITTTLGSEPSAAVDLDNDGWLDVAGIAGDGISFFHNNHDSTFTASRFRDYINGIHYGFAMADVDGDGKMDAVFVPLLSPPRDTIYVVTARNIGNNEFQITQIKNEGPSSGGYATVSLADMNGDGAVDAVVAFSDVGELEVLINDSSESPLGAVDVERTPTQMWLEATYPNPSSGIAHIEYSISQAQHCTVLLIGPTGDLVARLCDTMVGEGIHSLTYDTANIPSGAYVVELVAQGMMLSKQFSVAH